MLKVFWFVVIGLCVYTFVWYQSVKLIHERHEAVQVDTYDPYGEDEADIANYEWTMDEGMSELEKFDKEHGNE